MGKQMAGILIVRDDQIELRPGKGEGPIKGLHSMRVMTGAPHITYLSSPPNHYAVVHSHTEAEIMVVIKGRMLFNGQWRDVGSLIYVPANEEYWYSTVEERCLVSLIRPNGQGEIRAGKEALARGRSRAEQSESVAD
jgi:mannose-6-phosphate isomerase-like protein (cupin superfamily)